MFSASKSSPNGDERQSKVASSMEPAGSHLHNDFNSALRKGHFSTGIILSMDDSLRQTWRDLFDPKVEGFAKQNYELLRSIFDTFGDLRLSELEIDGRIGANRDAIVPSFREFVNGKPIVFDSKQKCLFYSKANMGVSGLMEILMNRNESYFVVPVMNGGFYLGAETSAILRRNGKFAGFALAGYSADAYYHKNHHYLLRDGSSMVGNMYIAPQDMELIDRNKDKPMLIVDDLIATGDTTAKVAELLRGRGVREVYKIVNDYTCLYL